MLATDLAISLDPVQLAVECGIDPDPWQRDVLRSDASRLLLNCCRQSGKSTITAILGVHRAQFVPGSLVLLLSPSLRQSQEIFRKCLDVYHTLQEPVPADSETKLTLELSNGSRIVSLPGTERKVRGFSNVDLLIVDEAAHVPDTLYYSVRPMLAVSAGRLIALSTPFGARGWFHQAWTSGESWDRYEVSATECPRISPEFLAEEKRTIGHYWFEQEYLVRFLDSTTAAFRRADLDRLFSERVEPWKLPRLSE